jgi:nucleoid-associated protein YgaU
MSVINDPLLISLHPTHRPRSASAVRTQPRTQPRTQKKAGAFRRRRILVAALSLFVVASGAFTQSAMANKPGVGYQGVPRTVVAAPGDSLWNIARRISPTGNISSLVDQLVRLNGEQVSVGQIIRIP